MRATRLPRAVTVAICVFGSSLCGGACARAPNEPRSEKLDTPREIAGVPCAKRAFFGATGRLESCTLSRDFTFANGVRLEAGAHVGVDADGRPDTAFLPRNTTLDGHQCIGDGSHDPMTRLHPNGRLKFCNLVAPERIQGVLCQRSSFWIWITQGGAGTYFHDNGALEQCLLAEDAHVDGRQFRRKSHVRFDREGRLVRGDGRE